MTSLLSLLKRKGLADRLSASALLDVGARGGFSFFDIDIELTVDGLAHVDDVLVHVFEYISLLRDSGAQEWIVEELRRIGELHFRCARAPVRHRLRLRCSGDGLIIKPGLARRVRYKDKDSYPSTYASQLADNMHLYEPELVVYGPEVIRRFDRDMIVRLIHLLRPDNMRCARGCCSCWRPGAAG